MSFVFDGVLAKLTSGDIDFEALDLRMAFTENGTIYTPPPSLVTVAGLLVVCNELTATGYARQTFTGLTDSPGAGASRVLSADAVTFPITQSGQQVAGGFTYVHVTDDSDSWLFSWHPECVGTTIGTDVEFDPVAGFVEVAKP